MWGKEGMNYSVVSILTAVRTTRAVRRVSANPGNTGMYIHTAVGKV